MDQLPLQEIQGLILRGYGMDALRVFVLRVDQASRARLLLADLPIANAVVWDNKPDFCLNVAITYDGLGALGLEQQTLESFPDEFKQGAVARAGNVGDIGQSAPENWKGGLGGPGVHVLVLLFAQNAEIREAQSQRLRGLWAGALSEVSSHDAYNLPGDLAHFGFRDGFSQPTIAGAPPNPLPDTQPQAQAGEFLLGYESQFTQFTYQVPSPAPLGLNGSFLALRILAQDCAAFEKLLAEAPGKYGITGEMLAAKMVGRWRNGVPLIMSPATDTPNPPVQTADLNKYDYANDDQGNVCPIGSHMRRANPRNTQIAGAGGSKHRIVRRGLPYGPPFDPDHPDDGVERGLLGLFIGVSLKDQFEFIMSTWINDGLFAAGIAGTKDPVLGNTSEGTGKFNIPSPGKKPLVVSGFSRLVQTRGAAYAFIPSISGLKFIAQIS
jgi:deferrochelatase/peroxidase EfeB